MFVSFQWVEWSFRMSVNIGDIYLTDSRSRWSNTLIIVIRQINNDTFEIKLLNKEYKNYTSINPDIIIKGHGSVGEFTLEQYTRVNSIQDIIKHLL